MYLMVYTRPNRAHVVEVMSRYIANLRKKYWEVVKWLSRYMRDISGMALCCMKESVTLQGYIYADLGIDMDKGKEHLGLCFYLR